MDNMTDRQIAEETLQHLRALSANLDVLLKMAGPMLANMENNPMIKMLLKG